MNDKLKKRLKIGLIVLLLSCLIGDLPYGYFILVRFIATIIFVLLAINSNDENDKQWAMIYGILALLFQPFLKVELGRDIWVLVDLVVAIGLGYNLYKGRDKSKIEDKAKIKSKTTLERAEQDASAFIVYNFREYAKIGNCAPTSKTSDDKIIEIYQKVGSSFRQVANERNEILEAKQIDIIVFKFLQVYERMGDNFLEEHLQYEIKRYRDSGLREDYK